MEISEKQIEFALDGTEVEEYVTTNGGVREAYVEIH